MDHRTDPELHARLMEAARLRALRLRREAIAAFWPGVAAWSGVALRAGWRRLARPGVAHRLQEG